MWNVLKKSWRWIVAIGLFILAAVGIYRLRKVILGLVQGAGDSWVPVAQSDYEILVTPDDGGPAELVTLPGKLTYQDVRAVKLASNGPAIVEVRHEVVDRTNIPHLSKRSSLDLGTSSSNG